jgi:predicted PurR-regulated permease PerM
MRSMIQREKTSPPQKEGDMKSTLPESQTASGPSSSADNTFIRRLVMTICAMMAAVVFLFIMFYTTDVFLLFFGSLLVSIFLKRIGMWISARSRLSERFAIVVTLIMSILFLLYAFETFFPTIARQSRELAETLPQAFESFSKKIQESAMMQSFGSANLKQFIPDAGLLIRKTAPAITTVLGGFVGFLIMAVAGFYLSVNANYYSDAFLRLFPLNKRDRSRQVLSELEDKLHWWLIGRFFGMLIIASLTTIGLSLLHIPLAFSLGFIAGLLNFIPNFGPILSVVPAVLIAFAQSPDMALYVVFLYAIIQFIESYILTPMIERQTVSLSPVLVIFAQIFMGLLLGFLGLLFASPLAVVIVVLTKHYYIEDILGDYGKTPRRKLFFTHRQLPFKQKEPLTKS